MELYQRILEFKKRHQMTIGFRLKDHCQIIEKYLNPGEEIRYAFFGQKNDKNIAVPNSYVIALSNKRLLLGRKRIFFGYFFYGITPDMFNDLKVKSHVIWGQIIIDTIKEVIKISNIDKNALNEIETKITEYMMKKKDNKLGK